MVDSNGSSIMDYEQELIKLRQEFETYKLEMEDKLKSFRVIGRGDLADGDVDRQISVGAGGGTFSVLDYPAAWIKVTHVDGIDYGAGLWPLV